MRSCMLQAQVAAGRSIKAAPQQMTAVCKSVKRDGAAPPRRKGLWWWEAPVAFLIGISAQ